MNYLSGLHELMKVVDQLLVLLSHQGILVIKLKRLFIFLKSLQEISQQCYLMGRYMYWKCILLALLIYGLVLNQFVVFPFNNFISVLYNCFFFYQKKPLIFSFTLLQFLSAARYKALRSDGS